MSELEDKMAEESKQQNELLEARIGKKIKALKEKLE